MSERIPAPRQPEVAAGNFEGNIRMPQNYFGISVFAGERCLRSENPSAALEELLSPIPLDDPALLERTRKANVQHVYHNIRTVLHPEDVRGIQAEGNWYALEMFLNILDIDHDSRKPDMSFGTDGSWATEAEKLNLRKVQEYISNPEHLAFLRKLYDVLIRAFKDTRGSEILGARKALLNDWSSLSSTEDREERTRAFTEKSREMYDHIRDALHTFAGSELKDHEREIVLNFAEDMGM